MLLSVDAVAWSKVVMASYSMCIRVMLTGVFINNACLICVIIQTCCCRHFRAVCIGRSTSTWIQGNNILTQSLFSHFAPTLSVAFEPASNSPSSSLGLVHTSRFQPTCTGCCYSATTVLQHSEHISSWEGLPRALAVAVNCLLVLGLIRIAMSLN